MFLLIPPPWLAEVLNSTAKIVASGRPRTDVVPLRNEFDILKSQTRSQALYTEVQRLKMATAAIPHAVQELTSLSILGREFFAKQKTSLLCGTTDILVRLGRDICSLAEHEVAYLKHISA